MTSVTPWGALSLSLALVGGCTQQATPDSDQRARGKASETAAHAPAALLAGGDRAHPSPSGAPRVLPDPSPPTPFGSAEVHITEPGAEPRVRLSSFPAGAGRATIRGSVSAEVTQTVAGVPRSEAPVPEVEFVAELTWQPAVSGGAGVIVWIREAKARSMSEVPEEVREGFVRNLADVSKKRYAIEVAESGEISPPTQHGDSSIFGVSNGAAKIVVGGLARALPVLTREPIGVGAHWTVRHRYRSHDGLSMDRQSVYRYEGLTGKRARLVLEGKDSGKLTAPLPGDPESPRSATSDVEVAAEYLLRPGEWLADSGTYSSRRSTTKVTALGETLEIQEHVRLKFSVAR